MANFSLLLMLLCCASCGETTCISNTMCTVTADVAECRVMEASFRNWSTTQKQVESCAKVYVYLAGGNHTVSEGLRFQGNYLVLNGSQDGPPSLILCSSRRGVYFHNQIVLLSNIKFMNCSSISFYGNTHYIIQSVTTEKSSIDTHNCEKESIVNSTFRYGSILLGDATNIAISSSTFEGVLLSNVKGESAYLKVTINRTRFLSSTERSLAFYGVRSVLISDSEFINSTYAAVLIVVSVTEALRTSFTITNTVFVGNGGALAVEMAIDNSLWAKLTISNCTFQRNAAITDRALTATAAVSIQNSLSNKVTIEHSTFSENYGHEQCASLEIVKSYFNTTLNNIEFSDNQCSGIVLRASNIAIQNWLNLTRNSGQVGGAIVLIGEELGEITKFSTLTLGRAATISLRENTAEYYGGGIYTDESCDSQREGRNCFFQTSTFHGTNGTAIMLDRNMAALGGDGIFGGCLSHCWIMNELINISNASNIFHDIISMQHTLSSSIIAEPSRQVMFCSNTSFYPVCRNNQKITAFPGETFYVALMIGSSLCFPTVGFMNARVKQADQAQIGDIDGVESYKKAKKYCEQYKYSINADLNLSSVTVELQIHRDSLTNYAPSLLTVVLADCPVGYEFNQSVRTCLCSEYLKSQQINCIAGTHSLEVPPLTWIGDIEGRPAVSKHCQYCRTVGDTIIDSTAEAAHLCTDKREGILCGQCSKNHSLLLGGRQCGKCYKSLHKGFLLVLGFAVIGIAMVLLLLRLDLTVSTGLVNGLIFYVNIVYANNDIFLPTNRDSEMKSRMDIVMSMFSTILAWMNLDFGIVTCFFDGYDTYISTWMQFIFPFYVWFLIIVIVQASRHSKRISRITTSNTVSVLATLLLLSYSKLLTTSIEASSYTDAIFLNDSSRHRVWVLDGSILYLHGRHIPLFIASFFTILLYILPFTLLIVLGPLLQSKSHYKLLKWTNKLKPFFDAYYGPYIKLYRYWPGVLLQARFITLNIFAYYSLGDSPFKLAVIFVMTLVLLLTWIAFGKNRSLSLYSDTILNYLELFFLLNLGVFSVGSISQFSEKHVQNQQLLALVMVGSVLMVFTTIVLHQIASISCIHRNLVSLLPVSQCVKFLSQVKRKIFAQKSRNSDFVTSALRESLLLEK